MPPAPSLTVTAATDPITSDDPDADESDKPVAGHEVTVIVESAMVTSLKVADYENDYDDATAELTEVDN